EIAGNRYRTANVEASEVVPVARTRLVPLIVEIGIGVQGFIPLEVVAESMNLAGSPFSDYVHRGSGIATVLRLIVVQQNFYLGDGIDPRRNPGASARSAVQIAGAIDGEVVRAGPVPLNCHVESAARRRFMRGEIDHAGQRLCKPEIVAADEHQIC